MGRRLGELGSTMTVVRPRKKDRSIRTFGYETASSFSKVFRRHHDAGLGVES